MSNNPILRNYVSEIDQFLQKFDQTHPVLSETQQFERNKHLRVYALRDKKETEGMTQPELWDKF